MESVRTAIWGNNVRPACKKPRTHAKKIQSASGVLRDPSRIKKGVLRVPPRPPRTKSCSSWPFVDQKVFFATLRVPSWIKKGVLRVSPRPPRTKRCSSWPFVDQKVFFVTALQFPGKSDYPRPHAHASSRPVRRITTHMVPPQTVQWHLPVRRPLVTSSLCERAIRSNTMWKPGVLAAVSRENSVDDTSP